MCGNLGTDLEIDCVFYATQVLGDDEDAEAIDILKPRKKCHRVMWFGAPENAKYGYVGYADASAYDAEAFRASLENVKRGREKLEAAAEAAEAYGRGELNASDAQEPPSSPGTVARREEEEQREREDAEAAALEVLMGGAPLEAPKAKPAKKSGGARRKKTIVEDEDEEPPVDAKEDEGEEYAPDAEGEDEDDKPKTGGKKRKLSKKSDDSKPVAEKKKPAKAEKKPRVEVEKPVIKVPSSTPRLLELKSELEDGLQAYEDSQAAQERARAECEEARAALAAAQLKVEQSDSHTNRVVRRLKQTARHIQEQSVNPTMLQETLITRTIKRGSKVKDSSLSDFAKTCGAVMAEWIELVRTSAATLIAVKPVAAAVTKEPKKESENAVMEDAAEVKPEIEEEPSRPTLPPVLGEIFAKAGTATIAPVVKPTTGGAVIPKEPTHDATRLRVARYLERECGLSRNASLTLEAAIFDQTAEPGLQYKSALKRLVDQPTVLSSAKDALHTGKVAPIVLLSLRGEM